MRMKRKMRRKRKMRMKKKMRMKRKMTRGGGKWNVLLKVVFKFIKKRLFN